MRAMLLLVMLVSLVGCRSGSQPTSADQAYLDSLGEAERTHIADGNPTVGDSIRGVMIALGKPAFEKKGPDGTEFVYYRVVSRQYPKTVQHHGEEVWDATTNLHILVIGDRVVRIKATPNYEDRDRGPARR